MSKAFFDVSDFVHTLERTGRAPEDSMFDDYRSDPELRKFEVLMQRMQSRLRATRTVRVVPALLQSRGQAFAQSHAF